MLLAGGGAGAFLFLKGDPKDESEPDTPGDHLTTDASQGDGSDDPASKDAGGGHGEDSSKEKDAEGKATPKPFDPNIELAPVQTNLSGERYTNVTVKYWIRARDEAAKKKIMDAQYKITSAQIMILSAKTRQDLESVEGMTLLTKQVWKQIDAIVGVNCIADMGYSHFKFDR